MQFAQLGEFFRSRMGGHSVSVAIGLTWFLFWPVQNNLSIVLVLVCLSLFIARGSTNFPALNSQSPAVLGAVGALALLGIITSFSYENISGLRTAGLVSLVTVLGLVIGTSVNIDDLLRGLLLGTSMTVVQGWVLTLDDDRLLQPSFYSGVTGSEPYEFFSVLVGLGSALALLKRRLGSVAVLSPLLALFIATVFYLDLIAAWLTAAVMLAVWVALLIVNVSKTQRVRAIIALVFLGFGAITLGILFVRSTALELAKVLGDSGSLEARYQIWDAIFQSMSPVGFALGYGASFWGTGSSAGDTAREIMLSFPGNDGHIHAHSAFLDFLISFGVLGSLIGIILVVIFVRGISQGWNHWEAWEARSSPWIFAAGLVTMGLVESAYVQNSAGWLFIGILLGSYVLRQPAVSETLVTDRSESLSPK